MIQRSIDNGIENKFAQPLRDLVVEFRSTFRTGFLSVPSKVDPLRIEFTPV